MKPKPRFAAFGPPLPPERSRAAQQAQELRERLKRGRLRFANAERDGQQLLCVARDGCYFWPPETPEAVASSSFVPASGSAHTRLAPASRYRPEERAAPSNNAILPPPQKPLTLLPDPPDAHLLQTLRVLADHSAPPRPLEVLSLLRPPYRTVYWRHGGPGTLHACGMAADIGAYGGYRITQSNPESCVQMTLALLRDLPPGKYRLGLPKAPETPLIAGRAFLPPPLYALAYPKSAESDVRAALPSRRGRAKRGQAPDSAPPDSLPANFASLPAALGSAAGCPSPVWPFFPAPEPEIKDGLIAATQGSRPRIVRFKNENYAPVSALADIRLRRAVAQAAKRGVFLVAVFPDGADHVHLDVKEKP